MTTTAVDVPEPACWAVFRDGRFFEFFDTYDDALAAEQLAKDVVTPMSQMEVDRVLAGVNVNHVDDPEDLLSTHKVNYSFEPKEKMRKRKTKRRKRVGVEFTIAGVKYTRIKDAQAALGVSYARVKKLIADENALSEV